MVTVAIYLKRFAFYTARFSSPKQCWRMNKTKMRLSGFDYDYEFLYNRKLVSIWARVKAFILFFLFPVPVVVCQQRACHLCRVYMGDWRAAFCWVCPGDIPGSLPQPPSLRQGSPAGFTFSKYHHSSPGRGAGGGVRGVRQGASNGAVCAPHPSSFLLHRLPRI